MNITRSTASLLVLGFLTTGLGITACDSTSTHKHTLTTPPPSHQALQRMRDHVLQDQLKISRRQHTHVAHAPDGTWSATLGDGARVKLRPNAPSTARSKIEVRLGAWGRVNALRAVDSKARARVKGNKISYAHGHGLTEWYHNQPAGLEHGFTIARRPTGAGALTMALNVHGGKIKSHSPTALSVTLPNNQIMRYDGLKVWDAHHKPLPAHMVVTTPHTAHMIVDDHGATYPVTIDPVWNVVSELSKSENAASQGFGYSIDVDGNQVIIGAPGATAGAESNAGAAYIYERDANNWRFVTKLIANRPVDGVFPESGERFGETVSISGDYAIIGGPGRNILGYPNAGAVYLFKKDNLSWRLIQEIVQGEGTTTNGLFGHSVSVLGDRVAIGAPGLDTVLTYKITNDNADKVSDLFNPDGSSFGHQVLLHGENLYACSPTGTKDNLNDGFLSVYTWNGNDWAGPTRFNGTVAAPKRQNMGFCQSLAIHNNWMVVGAQSYDAEAGIAFFYQNVAGAWQEHSNVSDQMPQTFSRFGAQVAITENKAAITSMKNGAAGQVLMYSLVDANTPSAKWMLDTRLNATTPEPNAEFGRGSGFIQGQLLIGMPYADKTNNVDTGAVFEYEAEEVNTPPTFTQPTMDTTLTIQAEKPWQYIIRVTDAQGDVTYDINGSPAGLIDTIANNEMTLSWTPTINDVGASIITITATDGDDESTSLTITLNVTKEAVPVDALNLTTPARNQIISTTTVLIEGTSTPNEQLSLEIVPECGEANAPLTFQSDAQGAFQQSVRLDNGTYTLRLTRNGGTTAEDRLERLVVVEALGVKTPTIEGSLFDKETCTYTFTTGETRNISGTGPAGARVELRLNDNQLLNDMGTLLIDADGTWRYTLPEALPMGPSVIEVRIITSMEQVSITLQTFIGPFKADSFVREGCAHTTGRAPLSPLLLLLLITGCAAMSRGPRRADV